MKITINKITEITYHFLNDGNTVFIDLFYIPLEHRRKGNGTAAFKKFLTLLHEDVTEIRIVVSTNVERNAHYFWTKIGFHYLYNILEDNYQDDEIINSMTYPVKGDKPKIFVNSFTENNQSCFL